MDREQQQTPNGNLSDSRKRRRTEDALSVSDSWSPQGNHFAHLTSHHFFDNIQYLNTTLGTSGFHFDENENEHSSAEPWLEPQPQEQHPGNAVENIFDYTPLILPSRPVSPPLSPSSGNLKNQGLPLYVEDLPVSLQAEDLTYLRAKGVFRLPKIELRDELLRQYVQFVHPFMPVLDLAEFLTAIARNDGSNRVSLFLFHAVMFTATAFVDMKYIRAEGYKTRREAREAFYTKTRLMYEFGCDSDRVPTLQALLLLSYWCEKLNDPKGASHWSGLSISMAHTLGLHWSTTTMEAKDRGHRKRLWWSCFMRDQLISLGMRRPPRVNHDNYDIAMLTVDDFDTDPVPSIVCDMLGTCPTASGSSTRKLLAKMCIHMAKLSICINHLLRHQYHIQCYQSGEAEGTVKLVPKSVSSSPGNIVKYDFELEQLKAEQSRDFSNISSKTTKNKSPEDIKVLALHQDLLTMLQLTLSSTLHRPLATSTSDPAIAPELQEMSKRKVREAAAGIGRIVPHLYSKDLVRCLPPTGVTVLLPAITFYLQELQRRGVRSNKHSLSSLEQCRQALRQLQDSYATADAAYTFFEAAAQRLDIAISELPPSKDGLKSEGPKSDSLSSNDMTMSGPGGLQFAAKVLWEATLAPSERNLLSSLAGLGSELGPHGPIKTSDTPPDHIPDIPPNGDVAKDISPLVKTNTSKKDVLPLNLNSFGLNNGTSSKPAMNINFDDYDPEPDWTHEFLALLGSEGANFQKEGNHMTEELNLKNKQQSSHRGITGDLELDLGIGTDED